MNLDRIAWRARASGPTRRAWTRAEVARLESLVGKCAPAEMARGLNRPLNAVVSKLMRLGYRISADVMLPIGLTAVGVARRIGVPYYMLHRTVQSGSIVAPVKANKKDYLLRWPAVRRLEGHYQSIADRRRRVLDRIKERTISKQRLMQILNISETQVARYLEGGIVKSWKVPCMWSAAGRSQWEWRVSRRDAARVKRLRESSHLKLRTKKYIAIQRRTSAEVARLRRERRLRLRDELHRKKPPLVPGTYNIPQVAQLAGISESEVYEHAKNGRLKARRVPVGKRNYIVVEPAALAPYLKWCQRLVKATGPLHPRQRQKDEVHRRGLLTIPEAAEQFNLNVGSLRAAISAKRVRSLLVDGMRGLRRRDVAVYAKTIKRRPKRK